MRLRGRDALVLFVVGAGGGLIGDACHVVAGVTTYLDESLPFIWKSQLWFPIAVGLATVSVGEVRLRLGPTRQGGDMMEGLAAIASVVGIYALTAAMADEEPLTTTVLIWCLALLVLARFGDGRPALICATLAAILGPLAEVAIVEADMAAYSTQVDGYLGVAEWLPALYFAFGVVAARLTELLAAPRLASGPEGGAGKDAG